MKIVNMSRRSFLKTTAAAGGGLVLGFHLPGALRFANAANQPSALDINAWIQIGADESITVLVPSSEMGQGVYTSVPMIVADEMEADWQKVRAEMTPVGASYKNPIFQLQATGGSTTIRGWWPQLSKVGAAAREMLVQAAADQWKVPAKECKAENGMVVHSSGKKLSYGSLASAAAKMQPPENPQLKSPDQYRYIGKPVKRIDTSSKVNGSAVFGVDVDMPDLLVASVRVSPVFGGEVASMDKAAAMKVKGVKSVVPIPNGVAVVADGYWPAKKGLDALNLKFDEGKLAQTSDATIFKTFHESLDASDAAPVHKHGDADGALKTAAKTLEAVYELPYLAHATMEPMNCTAHVTAEGCDIWGPTQGQDPSVWTAAAILKMPPDKIRVHTTFLGGGFGRRFETDFVAQAVIIAKAVGKPVKVIWSREEDTQHDFYRPASVSRFEVGLDKEGMPVSWKNRIVSPSIMTRVFPDFVKNGVDGTSVEGANELPYSIPNQHVDYVMRHVGIPVGFWRSVGSSHNAFYVESMIDEMADAAGQDPFEYRRKLLKDSPRHLKVLETVAEKAGWGKSLPDGVVQGIALHKSFESIVGQVIELSVSSAGEVKIHRMVCAVDCGKIVNPDTVIAQMESGIIYGLTATLKGEINIENGRVKQSNFHDYEMLRMADTPEIETHLIASNDAPGGVGEPGTPPVAPVVANAIFRATGKRLRSLPINKHDLKPATS